ncbi:MAG TPA: prolipoprotein diacylglyceryl transferase [Candidatus Baltobacteraceae bacterium]|jgi:phosphatidylglycerol:prolipoprotein diacylglycerol transferase|nr:prolipoprotein diacylglyceryl transferase [Candidatus Baltobacteraceae bacterium]
MHHWFTYPNISPIAFRIGPLAVHWYGISYLIGFIAVYLWMSRPEGRRRLGLTREQIQDFLVYALVGVLVGGRTFFVINDIISKHDASSYLTNPLNLIAVWNGGMAFHGGLIGVIVAIALFLRKHPGLTFSVLGDEVVVLLPVGIALTRVVNFINDELWGDVCKPDHPWCMQPGAGADLSAAQQGQYLHPSQLYEAILDAITLPIIYFIYKRRPPDGVTGWSWFTIYGITRTIAESWRHADFVWHGITGGQLYAIPMIPIGIAMIVYCYRKGVRTDERAGYQVGDDRAAVR